MAIIVFYKGYALSSMLIAMNSVLFNSLRTVDGRYRLGGYLGKCDSTQRDTVCGCSKH